MSQENLELVRRGMESVDAFWAMLDEYVIWDLRAWPVLDLHHIYVGRDAVIEASRRYWGAWTDYRVEAEELVDVGPSVFVALREYGRGKGSGAPFEKLHPQLWTFRGGLIIRWDSFQSRAEALAAAGL